MSHHKRHVGVVGQSGDMAENGIETQDFALFRHNTFESLLAQRDAQTISASEIIELALDRGRVLVQGPAGAGKSLLASRIASNDEPTMVAIDGSSFGETVSSAIGATFWLIEAVVGTEPGFVALLDGLEAVSDEQFEWLVAAIDDYARDEPRAGFVVFDRVQRRPISLRRWALVSLTGLDAPEFTDSTSEWQKFAIYQQMREGDSGSSSPVELFRNAFESALRGTGVGLPDLAATQLSARLETTSSAQETMALPRLDQAVIESLTTAGLAASEELSGVPSWSHRLVALFLEANELARRPEIWGPDTFRQLTDDGTQFDVLAFALELIADEALGGFVRAVDDWSYVAGGRLLAHDSRTAQRVPSDLQLALLLLMGRRLFSEIPATRIQAGDILLEHRSATAKEILDSKDEQQLVELAHNGPETPTDWWSKWHHLFAAPSSLGQERKRIEALKSKDGVLAWTAANSLCLVPLRPKSRSEIYRLSGRSESEMTRWRAVHAIGGTARPEVVAFALEVFDNDPSRWVKYGSLRSAILVTAHLRSAAKRRDAIEQLVQRSLTILSTPRLLDVTESSLLVEDSPEGWLNDAGPLIESLWANSTSVAEQDRWRDLSRTLRSRL